MTRPKKVYRYSEAFKLKVISEIESGKFSIAKARKIYDIKGPATIHRWIRKYGRNHLLNKVVRVEMREEKDKLKHLSSEKKELESALAQAHLKILALESLVEATEEHYQIDLKKNFGQRVSKKQSSKHKSST
ncbi:MAG: transposase [bacterium]